MLFPHRPPPSPNPRRRHSEEDPAMAAEVAVGERTAFSGTDFVVRYGVVLVGVLVAIVFSFVIPGFATLDNAVSILQTQAVAAVAALGMTLTAVVGDLDLSVGAV